MEQLAKGLDDVGILKFIRSFPLEFERLLTNQSQDEDLLTGPTVFKMFRFPTTLSEVQIKIAEWLKQFILSSTLDGQCYYSYFINPRRACAARVTVVNPRRACARVTVVVLCEGYDTGLLGVRDFRISVISN